MKSRCYLQCNVAYPFYGGRGIGVCDRWRFGEGGLSGFECFLADMGEKPEGKTLDRYPDKDGDYHPDNCRWASRKEQQNNLRNNRFFEYEGNRYNLYDLARHTGVSYELLRARLTRSKKPWTVEQAVKTPPIPPGHNRRPLSDWVA